MMRATLLFLILLATVGYGQVYDTLTQDKIASRVKRATGELYESIDIIIPMLFRL